MDCFKNDKKNPLKHKINLYLAWKYILNGQFKFKFFAPNQFNFLLSCLKLVMFSGTRCKQKMVV